MAEIETIGAKKQAPKPAEKKAAPRPAPRRAPSRNAAPAQQEPVKEEALTAEQWKDKLAQEARDEEGKAKLEEAKAQNRLMTKEEFLALQQRKPAQAPQKAPMSESKARVMGMINGMVDNAMGIKPVQETHPAGAPPVQGGLQEVSTAEGLGGLIQNMRESPIISGGVLMIGLVMILVGIHLKDPMSAMVTDGIGMAMTLIGLIFVFGHIRIMMHRPG